MVSPVLEQSLHVRRIDDSETTIGSIGLNIRHVVTTGLTDLCAMR